MKMPFGKHQGQPLSALPNDYLAWLLDLDLREPLLSAVRQEQAARRDPAKPDPVLANRVITHGFRVLAVKSHPDTGGNTSDMQRLNSTVQWLRRQTEVLT